MMGKIEVVVEQMVFDFTAHVDEAVTFLEARMAGFEARIIGFDAKQDQVIELLGVLNRTLAAIFFLSTALGMMCCRR